MTATETYAASVVRVLAEHFPDLADPGTASVVTWWIGLPACDRDPSGECIVDDPRRACWRLIRSDDRRVRLAYYPVSPPGSEADNALEVTVNKALRELEGPR